MSLQSPDVDHSLEPRVYLLTPQSVEALDSSSFLHYFHLTDQHNDTSSDLISLLAFFNGGSSSWDSSWRERFPSETLFPDSSHQFPLLELSCPEKIEGLGGPCVPYSWMANNWFKMGDRFRESETPKVSLPIERTVGASTYDQKSTDRKSVV